MDTAATAYLFSPVQAAQLLNLSRSTIYELMGQGRLGSVKVGRSRRISSGQLAAFLDSLDAAG